jgi:fatty acid desaturase
MKQQLPMYALALAVLIIGLAAVGVAVTTLLFGLIVLACPLMMMLMMSGMHGGSHESGPDRPGAPPEQSDDERAVSGPH